jgi:hypothetical protein
MHTSPDTMAIRLATVTARSDRRRQRQNNGEDDRVPARSPAADEECGSDRRVRTRAAEAMWRKGPVIPGTPDATAYANTDRHEHAGETRPAARSRGSHACRSARGSGVREASASDSAHALSTHEGRLTTRAAENISSGLATVFQPSISLPCSFARWSRLEMNLPAGSGHAQAHHQGGSPVPLQRATTRSPRRRFFHAGS